MNLRVLLTTPTTDAGPFYLYSDTDGFVSPFASNIDKTTLLSGYVVNAPEGTTSVKIVSVSSDCNSSKAFPISQGCSSGIDVVFLIDYTSSMDPSISSIKSNVESIVSEISTLSNGNYRLALGIFDEQLTSDSDDQTEYYNSLHYNLLPSDQKYVNQSVAPDGREITQYITFLEKFGQVGNSDSFKSSLFLLDNFTYFNNSVSDFAILPDDSFLTVGNFTNVLGKASNRMIRMFPNYRPDYNFDIGAGFNSTVICIKIQSDGKILVGGTFTSFNNVSINRLVRLNSDYTIDSSFATNLGSGFNNTVHDIVEQPDGKIIVVGTFTQVNGVSTNRIIRLEADGTLDLPFETNVGNGFVGIQNATDTITLQPDGKILIGGSFSLFNGVLANRIVRLNADGTRDATFVTGSGFSDFSNRVFRILLQGTDILCFGNITSYNGTATQGMIKLNSTGGIVQAFPSPTGFNNFTDYANFTSDGKIVITGRFSSFNSVPALNIVRLNSDLTLDPTLVNTFSVGSFGFPKFRINSVGTIICNSPNLSTYRIVYFENDTNLANLKNFDLGNGLQSSEPSGLALEQVFKFDAVNSFRSDVAKIVFIITDNPSSYKSDIYDQDAYEKVTSFIPELVQNGIRIIVLRNFTFVEIESMIAVSGRVYTGGFNLGIVTDENSNLIEEPMYPLEPVYNEFAYWSSLLKPSNDGKFFSLGQIGALNRSGSRFMVKFNLDYTVDQSFALPEISSSFGYYCILTDFAYLQPNKILIGGDYFDTIGTHSTNNLALINLDGSVNTSFVSKFPTEAIVSNIHIRSNGNVVFTGYFLQYDGVSVSHIIEVLPDFSINPSFVTTGFDSSCRRSVLQSDGKIVCVGSFFSYNGTSVSRIVRINTDGSIDSSYLTGSGLSITPYRIIIQDDDKCILIFSGFGASYNGVPQPAIFRLNADGTVDSTFNAAISNAVYGAAILPDGKIAVGGEFTTYGSDPVNGFVVLNPDGSLYSSSSFSLMSTYRDSLKDLVTTTGGVFVQGYNGEDVISSMNLICT